MTYLTTNPITKGKHAKWYSVYKNMCKRCLNTSNPSYKDYGAKGVTICNEWLDDKQAFASWYDNECKRLNISMENTTHDLDKDLLSNSGSKLYSPDTCQLIPTSINRSICRATNKHVFIDPNGTKHTPNTIKELADTHGLSYDALRNLTSGRTRKHKGWTLA